MKCKSLLSTLLFISYSASANNVIHYSDFMMYMDKKERSIIHVVNDNGRGDFLCKIKNWEDRFNTGGYIDITNDEKGLLIYPTNKYLSIDELIRCSEDGIELHKIPQSDDKLDTIVDINFDKRLVLLVALNDVRVLSYTAIVSNFGSNKNLLSGPGFFSGKNSDIPFGVGDNQYGGKISLDGKYVSPVYLSCFVDSFPGLWDIRKNKRVVFDTSLGDDEIKDRCQKLFDGKATLEELGGKLIRPKK